MIRVGVLAWPLTQEADLFLKVHLESGWSGVYPEVSSKPPLHLSCALCTVPKTATMYRCQSSLGTLYTEYCRVSQQVWFYREENSVLRDGLSQCNVPFRSRDSFSGPLRSKGCTLCPAIHVLATCRPLAGTEQFL